jgi:hypothetical protein
MDSPASPTPAASAAELWISLQSARYPTALARGLHGASALLLLVAVLGLLWLVPVPPALVRPGAWAGLAMMALTLACWKRSRPLGLAMLVLLVALGLALHRLHLAYGEGLLAPALGAGALALIGQFSAWRICGSAGGAGLALHDLLLGPAWLLARLLRALGLRL